MDLANTEVAPCEESLGASASEDDIFVTHDDYPKLLAGAHRRRISTIKAPAVIRHLAFWNPPKIGPSESGDSESEQHTADTAGDAASGIINKRVQAADDCVAAVYKWLVELGLEADSSAITKLVTNSEVDLGGGPLVVLFGSVVARDTGEKLDCPTAIRPDTYRSIKIRFFWHGIATTLDFELHTEFMTLTTILEASEQKSEEQIDQLRNIDNGVFAVLYEGLCGLSKARLADGKICVQLHDQLYHAIWKRVELDLIMPLRDLAPSLGAKFADFRGIALGPRGPNPNVDFSPPFAEGRAGTRTGLEREAQCDIQDFDGLWDFLTCALPKDTEFTLSRFLKDRAFYATALGAQAEIFVGLKSTPLYYVLYEDTLNPWQLGRLIHRVHRAGAARIAAIMHFEQLTKASGILAVVEGILERAMFRLADFDRKPDTEDVIREDLRKMHRQAEARLGEISKLKLDGTLDSRIERSRYYVKQFCRATDALRIERVSGFQPYHEFVHQRMGPVFEYIDSLGSSYARVQNDRSLLLERIQALYSLHHASQMSQAQRQISVAEGQISEAQRIADIALSCALGPYYVGSIVSHALSRWIPEHVVFLYALTFGIVMFVFIQLGGEEGHNSRFLDTRTKRFALAFLLALLITWGLDDYALPYLPSAKE